MSIYPYRHRVTGPCAGTTVVYYANGQQVTYQHDGGTTYKVSYYQSPTSTQKFSPDETKPMSPKELANFEAIPTYEEAKARQDRSWSDYVDEHGYA